MLPAWLQRLDEIYRSIARRPALACATAALLCLSVRAAMLPRWHVPQPAVHDEFSYLLAADTYASGRLTNPQHPMWEHFETIHELQQPTYISKYPPLQGIVMALGQKLFGEPWFGVWLSAGLMCAATCWMLQGWISAEWALLGGLMVATHVGIFSYWMNSYWGGAIAASGGALVLGAAPRVASGRRMSDALMLASGLVILMNSRPYEGVILSVLTSAALVWWLCADRIEWRGAAVRILVPVVLVLAAAFLAMAYQNWRVTGNPLLLPYVAHDRQYAATSLFLWNGPQAPPPYRHASLRHYWVDWQTATAQKARQDIAGEFFRRIGSTYVFFFGFWPVLAIVMIWPFSLRTRQESWTVIILCAFLVATVAPLAGVLPHYTAPITALLYLRLLQALSRLPGWRPGGKPFGTIVVASLLVAWFLRFGTGLLVPEQVPQFVWDRAQVLKQIEKLPGDHLVLVRYLPDHFVHDEWVYNAADIDRSKIVWAREMGPALDSPLLRYYRDRHVWLLEADVSPPRLEPYPGAAKF